MNRWPVVRLLLALTGVCASACSTLKVAEPPRLLSWSEQLDVREAWLVKRHKMLLPMMRRHGVDMWILVNEEFHDDPLTQYVAPPRPYAGNRDLFIFIDAGEQGLKKVALSGREGSYIAIELNTRTPVPEWDGQEVFAMQEDPAWLTSEGWRFFVPRQEAYYLIP
ncbi:MAG TPA: hypothetical protein VK458_07870 [Myxococcaceae bacterium]|nr:hypothetical protein [Myxococcaceae bacterium]